MTLQDNNSNSNRHLEQRAAEIAARQAAELHEWRQHPVTQAVFRTLNEERQRLMEQWASAGFMSDPVEAAEAVGMCQAINKILNVKAEDLKL